MNTLKTSLAMLIIYERPCSKFDTYTHARTNKKKEINKAKKKNNNDKYGDIRTSFKSEFNATID